MISVKIYQYWAATQMLVLKLFYQVCVWFTKRPRWTNR